MDYGNDVSTDEWGSGFVTPDFSHEVDPEVDTFDSINAVAQTPQDRPLGMRYFAQIPVRLLVVIW